MEIKNIQDAVTAYNAQISSIMVVEAPDEMSRNFLFSNLMEEIIRQKGSTSFHKYFRFDNLSTLEEMSFQTDSPIINGKPYQKIFRMTPISKKETYGKATSPEQILELYTVATTSLPSYVQHHIDNGLFHEDPKNVFKIKNFMRNYYNISGNDLPDDLLDKAKDRKLWDEKVNQGTGRDKRKTPRNFKRDSLIVFIVDDLTLYEDMKDITIQVPAFAVREADRVTIMTNLLKMYKIEPTGKQMEQIMFLLLPIKTTAVRNIHLEFEKKRVETFEDVLSIVQNYTKDLLINMDVLEYLSSDVTFDQIGGFDHVKKIINENILNVWKNRKQAMEMGVDYEKGMILYGPPGTGKTQFARAIARELNLPVFKFDISKVLSKWVGDSERNLRTVFEMLERLDPCILFIDEIDSVGGNRNGVAQAGQHKVDRNLMNMLLQYISDDRNSIIIGATNMLHELDPALIRKGRLGTKIYIPYPGIAAREDIFEIHLNKRRKIPNSVDMSRLAKETRFWSGAEIEDICNKSGINLINTGNKEVTTNDMLELIKQNEIPQTREMDVAFYQAISDHFKCHEGEGERTEKKLDGSNVKNVSGPGTKYFPTNFGDALNN